MTKKLSLKKMVLVTIAKQLLISQFFNLVLAYFFIDLTLFTLLNCVEVLVILVFAYKAFNGYLRGI